MKRFILHGICFAAASLLLAVAVFEVVFHEKGSLRITEYFSRQFSWLRVYHRVQASHKPMQGERLILGDSVGLQMFPYDPAKGVLCANGSVYAAGNYVLCKNALDANPQIKEVLYVTVPGVLGHKFERSNTCNSFVKPFYSYIGESSIDGAVHENPMARMYALKLGRCLPIDEFDYDDGVEKHPLQWAGFAVEHLLAIANMCKNHGVAFRVISPPIPQSDYGEYLMARQSLVQRVLDNEPFVLSVAFKHYFDSVKPLSDDSFHDGRHLSDRFLRGHPEERKRMRALADQVFAE